MLFVKQLQAKWTGTGISQNSGTPDSQLRLACTAMGVNLPMDLFQYFVMIDGMTDAETDEQLLHFHSFKSSQAIFIDWSHSKNQFVIIDHLLFSKYYYLIANKMESGIYVTDGIDNRQVSPTFCEFITKYLADPTSLAR